MKLPRIFPPKKQNNALQISARYKSGVALMKKNRLDEAAFQLKRALSLGSNHSSIHYRLGQISYEQGEFEQALASFEEALKMADDRRIQAMAHTALGSTFLELKHFDRALQEYDTALELDPTRKDMHSRFGEVYYESQQYDKAIENLEKAGKDDVYATVRLADAHWNLGNQDRSIALLSEAAKKFDDVQEVFAYLGYYLFEAAQYEEAIETLEQAIKLSEDYNEKTLFNLASSHYELGHLDEALEVYQKVIELFPDSAFTYRRIGFIYYEQEKFDKAVEIWQQMLPIDVDDPAGAHRTLAHGYRAIGDLEAALNEVRQANSLVLTDGLGHVLEGIILEDMDKQKEALEAFQRAVRFGDDFALLSVARVHQTLGNFDEVVHYAETFIEAAKHDEELKSGLEDALEMIKEIQEHKGPYNNGMVSDPKSRSSA